MTKDRLFVVDHASTQGMALRKVVKLLRGDPGSTAMLTISRGKQAPFDVTLTRQRRDSTLIQDPSVLAFACGFSAHQSGTRLS